MKFAIVGTSWISEEFYKASRLANMQLKCIYSRNIQTGEAFCEKIGCRVPVITSLEALAQSDIDAVYIASPNSLHALQSEFFLRAGKHVLCEKPISLCPGDVSRLRDLAREKRLIYMEAIMYLHTPGREIVQNALQKIGEITSVHFDFSQLSSRYAQLKAGQITNVFDPKMGGGALNDLGCYCVYPAVDLFGVPKNITCFMHYLCTGADGAGSVIFEYDQFPLTITFSKTGQSRGVSQIMGSDGTLAIDSISQFQGIRLNGDLLDAPVQKHEIMACEARAFCDFVQHQSECPDAELCIKVAETMHKIRIKGECL